MEAILALTFVTILGLVAFASLTALGMVSLLRVDTGVAPQVIKALKDLISRFF